MAQPMHCDLCEEELAVMVITQIEDGRTIYVGGRCLGVWCRTMLEILDGGDGPDTSSSDGAEAAAGEDDPGSEPAAADDSPKRSGRKTAEPKPAPDTSDDAA